MTIQNDERLLEAIRAVATKVSRFKDRGLGEQNTKASMIEPILESLGWDIRDPEEVHREFKPTTRDNPVDYALKILRKPRLFVEAKGLGEDLVDRRWVAQVLGYATVAGVEWCVLTDGNHFRFYNATVALDADEKLFCELRLSESDPADAAKTLRLISRNNMEENLISVMWSAHFVDRQVKESLQTMIETTDKRLVRLIRAQSVKLRSSEIVESLRRLDIRIEQPFDLPDLARGSVENGQPESLDRAAAARKAWETRRSKDSNKSQTTPQSAGDSKRQKSRLDHKVKLADLIAAGLLKPPTKLFRTYKGTFLEALLNSDGSVDFQGKSYPSASTAAENARAVVAGEKLNTNGWQFWQLQDSKGKTFTLFDIRDQFLKIQRPANHK